MAIIKAVTFEITPALMSFRKMAGEGNYHLNTLLTGLRTLQANEPELLDDLAVDWRKPTKPEIFKSCGEFAIKMMLVTVIDSIDQYLKTLPRIHGLTPPSLDETLIGRKKIREGDRTRRLTIGERVSELNKVFPAGKAHWISGINLLIYWRNSFVHGEYKHKLSDEDKEVLSLKKKYFKDEHQNSDIIKMISDYERGEPPTLRQLSTLISIVHRCLSALDERILVEMSGEDYAESLLKYVLDKEADQEEFIASIWKKGHPSSTGRLMEIFSKNGAVGKIGRGSAPQLTSDQVAGRFGRPLGEVKAMLLAPPHR